MIKPLFREVIGMNESMKIPLLVAGGVAIGFVGAFIANGNGKQLKLGR